MKRINDIIRAARKEGRTHLLEHEAKELAEAVGIPVPPSRTSQPDSADALRSAADDLGYPVVLKALSRDIMHKTDAGAVLLNISDAAGLAEAAKQMKRTIVDRSPGAKIESFLVERMMPPGLELLVGGLRDEQFGPTIAFGLGGIWVEALRDAAFGILPMTREETRTMMRLTRAWTFLEGFRGSPPLDKDAVFAVISAASRLLTEVPEIREIDLNPVRVYEKGAAALDVRVVLQEV